MTADHDPGGADAPQGRSREVVAWCLFDFANSSYTTLIMAASFPVFFQQVVVGATDNRGDALWGIANSAAMLATAVVSPFLGALADSSGRRKRLLVLTTLATVGATGLLAFVGKGSIALALGLYVVGTFGYETGYTFYNAFLPDVSTPSTVGRVSGWGWAIGYVGGLLALVACYPLIGAPLRSPSGEIDAASQAGYRVSFLLVAAFYLVFALPAFVWLRESAPQGSGESLVAHAREGLRRVADTLRHLQRYRETAKYVAASLFYADGINTIIAFSAIFAVKTFGFSQSEVVVLFIALNVVAFPGSLVAGRLADRFGSKSVLTFTLVLWVGVVITGSAAHGKAMFWIMASGAAIGMGSTQAVGRSFMAQISPPYREAEFFGFYVWSGKLASAVGPLVFGWVSALTGSQRLSVLSLLPFFIAALALMLSIDEDRAIRDSLRPGG